MKKDHHACEPLVHLPFLLIDLDNHWRKANFREEITHGELQINFQSKYLPLTALFFLAAFGSKKGITESYLIL